jgi:hypothetical protein
MSKKMDWVKKSVEMEVKKGPKSSWWLMKIVGKDGKVKKFIFREVDKFLGEEEEGKDEEMGW